MIMSEIERAKFVEQVRQQVEDQEIISLRQEAARWKQWAIEAANRACEECDEYYSGKKNCKSCRMAKIREEAQT